MQAIVICSNEVKEQVGRASIARRLELADASRLDEIYDSVSELKAQRCMKLQKLRESGESLEMLLIHLLIVTWTLRSFEVSSSI